VRTLEELKAGLSSDEAWEDGDEHFPLGKSEKNDGVLDVLVFTGKHGTKSGDFPWPCLIAIHCHTIFDLDIYIYLEGMSIYGGELQGIVFFLTHT